MNNQKVFTIIQLTRMGDLIQTHQAAKDFRLSHPDIRLRLVARKKFASSLSFLLENTFDEIITIDKEEFSHENLESYLTGVNAFIEKINGLQTDVVINLSFCQTSNYLASLIDCPNKLGTRINGQNQVIVGDQWSQLVYSTTMTGPYCPFNLVDIYKNILGLKERKIWEQETRHQPEGRILAIHPFASHEKKRWKPSKWSEVLFKLFKDHPESQVKIFGAPSEKELAEEILKASTLKKFSANIENHVGKHDLEGTFKELKKCSHFIGHDSLLGHLAKEAGLPTVTLSLGTVRHSETAPYGINSFVVAPRTKCFPCFPNDACSFYQCHADISYQAVGEILKGFYIEDDINIKKIGESVSPFHLDSIDIFRYGPTNIGWYIAEKLGNDHAITRDIVKDIYRLAFLFKFEEKEENLNFPALNKEQVEFIENLNEGVRQLYELCEFGKKYSSDVIREIAKPNPEIQAVKALGNKVDEVDRLMDLTLKAYPSLQPIIDFYKVVKFNLHGQNIVEISESSYIVYNDNAVVCSIVYELFQKTIQHNKKQSQINTKEGRP